MGHDKEWEMSEKITGRCLCGATTYSVNGPGKFGIVCFCSDCQRAAGTGHAPQLGVERASLTVDGPIKSFTQKADSGSDLDFRFCADCGSPLIKTTSRAPEIAFLYAGSLGDPEVFRDPKLVFEGSRQIWDRA